MIDKKNVNSMGRQKSKTRQKEKRIKVYNVMRRLSNMRIKVTSFRTWMKRICEVVFMKSQVYTERLSSLSKIPIQTSNYFTWTGICKLKNIFSVICLCF